MAEGDPKTGPTPAERFGSNVRPGETGLVGRYGRALLAPRLAGQVRYTDDIHRPGMLWGRLVRCPHPHARIVRIDATRALARPGVLAVITGKDLPERFGIIPWTPDEYPLALEKARFVGDAVAAVAATDERIAHEAAELIDVEYEILPAATDLDTAMREPSVGLGKNERDNVSKDVLLDFGDVDGELARSAVVVEGDYFYEGSAHVPIETHCAIGEVDKNGLLTVWSTTQVPHYLHRELSRVLGLSSARIRVIQPPIGGAFGGKSEPFSLEFAAAKLAMITGRPVKILYTARRSSTPTAGATPCAST
jgi:4-hydroxybenzoyl-CoA reductase subunit alpha